MSIIKRQTIKSTVYIYAGTVLGFFTTAILFPKYFTEDQNGVLSLLVSYALLFAQFATLGFNGATIRFFPYFRSQEKRHHGFLFILLVVTLLGFLLFLGIYYGIRPSVLDSNDEKSPLFVKYFDYIIPLTFFHLLFLALDSYNRVLYNATTGMLLKEFVQRMIILFSFLFFFLSWIAFEGFILLYTLSFGVTALLLVLFLIWRKEFDVKPDFSLLDKEMRRGLLSLSVFSFLTGFSGFAVTSIDRIMLNEFYSTYETGIYFVVFSFATLIIMPSRALKGIAPTLIADAFKNNDLEKVGSVYQKSTIIQFIIGLYLLLGLWGNVDNVFQFLPDSYSAGRYVILLIGLMNLIKMLSGVGDVVIGYSKYYKYFTLLMVLWLVLLVITNFIFIPMYGMNGAALASLIAMTIVTLLQFWFLFTKFGFQPYGAPHIMALGIACITYLIVIMLPDADHFMIDIIIKGIVISVIFLPAVYFLKLSPDFNHMMNELLRNLKK